MVGTADVNLLLLKSKCCMLISEPICDGIVSKRLLWDRSKNVSAVRLPILVGTVEVN